MTTALDGIIVVDLTHSKAGALAGMLLCDNGARVIRLVPPEGDRSRSGPGYIIWDRGKESVSLDIEKDRETFHKLVGVADVLIESFSPLDRHQGAVDYETLRGINPRLIQCSITAYGNHGPLRDEPPNDDLVMGRRSGKNHSQRMHRTKLQTVNRQNRESIRHRNRRQEDEGIL